jgi:hypothetical protein
LRLADASAKNTAYRRAQSSVTLPLSMPVFPLVSWLFCPCAGGGVSTEPSCYNTVKLHYSGTLIFRNLLKIKETVHSSSDTM